MHRTIFFGCTESMHSLINTNITIGIECPGVKALGYLVLGFDHVLFETLFNSLVTFPVQNQVLQMW